MTDDCECTECLLGRSLDAVRVAFVKMCEERDELLKKNMKLQRQLDIYRQREEENGNQQPTA